MKRSRGVHWAAQRGLRRGRHAERKAHARQLLRDIPQAAGDPERVGLVLFATVQGIAALVTGGMVQTDRLDALVADAIAHFLRGSLAVAVVADGERHAAAASS